MKKEVSDALFDFFQEFLKPELDEIKEKQSQYDGRFLDMLGHFDGVYKKLENLEVEYHSIVAGMDRLEKTQDRQGEQLSAKLDSVADDLTAHLRDTEAHKGGYRAGEELEKRSMFQVQRLPAVARSAKDGSTGESRIEVWE